MKNTWEKELLDKFGSDIKRDAMCPLEDFIRQLLAQERKEAFQEGAKIKKRWRNEDIEKIRQEERKEHIEMTKELVSKKNKDCQRYLETQKNIPMGVSQWKNHGKKWYYWEFWAEQERTQLLKQFEEIVGRELEEMRLSQPIFYAKNSPMINKIINQAKQEIRDKLKTLTKD